LAMRESVRSVSNQHRAVSSGMSASGPRNRAGRGPVMAETCLMPVHIRSSRVGLIRGVGIGGWDCCHMPLKCAQ
jgi:hypothetical protein